MKLNTKALRYLNASDWRVLTAVETGSRNHEVVPTPLIANLSKSSVGDVQRSISLLAKANLIAKVKNAKYDGYRLTYGGLDYLALHSLQKGNVVYSVGNQIGVGKESDIYVVSDERGEQRVLKIHRLGRVSFKKGVRNKRDYARTKVQKERGAGSWMYMSRLAAVKEYAYLQALHDVGLSVPVPLGQNRHQLVMSLVDGFPLRQIDKVPDPAGLYAELMEMLLRLCSYGLIHGDFNEFNILIKEVEQPGDDDGNGEVKLVPVLIDFPQMVSVDHANAEFYFQRDVDCVKRFFARRFGFTSNEEGPFFKDAKLLVGKDGARRLDVEVEASGFSKKQAKELEAYMKEHGIDGDAKDGAEHQVDRDTGDEDEDEDEDEVEGDDEVDEDDGNGERQSDNAVPDSATG
ncbi:Serine/threonine-protein kinase rio2 [Exophiala dermatitidis]